MKISRANERRMEDGPLLPDEETPFYLSTGDLMAALLMVFVLLLAGTLLRLQEDYREKVERAETYKSLFEDNEKKTAQLESLNQQYEQVSSTYAELVQTYHQLQESLYNELVDEFRGDLPVWSAEIDRASLSIRFKEPSVLFAQGEDSVTPRFREILRDFFPRYIRVLSQEVYRKSIEEIRIEGHTSSEWERGDSSQDVAYFNNMELSQNRTRRVLQECLGFVSDEQGRAWARLKITANGLSSSRLILADGIEDKKRSRRVEFRVRTDAETRIAEILSVVNRGSILSTGISN